MRFKNEVVNFDHEEDKIVYVNFQFGIVDIDSDSWSFESLEIEQLYDNPNNWIDVICEKLDLNKMKYLFREG